jgi:hypothetical protein
MRAALSNPSTLRVTLAVVATLLVAAALLARAAAARRRALRAPRAGSTALFPFDQGPRLHERLLRGALVVLALVVAAGFALILLPDRTVRNMAQLLEATRAADLPAERIALLYLGDETAGKEFHVRGIVRNISSQSIEKLDAQVRLHASDGTVLETVVARLDLDVIAPDATSEFHVVFPDYKGEFSSYAVDFKLRGGEPVPYKDRRGARRFR